MATFKEFKEAKGLTVRKLGEMTGIDFRVIHRYILGQKPNLKNAFKIYTATKGKVDLKDWFKDGK